MTELLKPDLCVIGAGAGGLSVAAAAAAFGVPVVLIEHGKMGGDCLNYGCVPSKALIAAAKRVADLTSLDAFGVGVGEARIDFAKVRAHLQGVIAALAPNDSVERFTGLGVRVIAGTARFTDSDTVTVSTDTTIKAGSYVIATGSSPANPLISGLADGDYLTNETIFDLGECPAHLVIIGGGAVGIEMAQAFRRLGAQVTVIEMRRALGNEDFECVDIVLAQLAREGIVIHAGAAVRSVERVGAGVKVMFETETGMTSVEGSHLLVAVGRRPNVDGLDLAAAGVKYNAGGITVDRQLRTSNKRIYAIGDVTGGSHFTHVASYHAGIVVRNALFRLRSKVDTSALPRVLFTDPELAHVGLTDGEALKLGHKIRVLRSPYFENDRAQIERRTRGHIKVVTDRRGNVLGATIVGDNAGEMISTWTLSMAQRINIRHMAQLVMPYPTLSEIGKKAAVGFFTPSLTTSWVRRIIDLLRRRG
ncbi:MAG TPA: FAD-dependent oxidoreductase [Xanthobacteraceae bacterium]|nr:FAD-dependent oxidoreductase [Xanthobacteraceae bacterium]